MGERCRCNRFATVVPSRCRPITADGIHCRVKPHQRIPCHGRRGNLLRPIRKIKHRSPTPHTDFKRIRLRYTIHGKCVRTRTDLIKRTLRRYGDRFGLVQIRSVCVYRRTLPASNTNLRTQSNSREGERGKDYTQYGLLHFHNEFPFIFYSHS